jgi:hypothetical protein
MSGRKGLAALLRRAARGELPGEDLLQEVASESWKELDWHSPLLARTYHFLQHFAADEDVRQTDSGYAAHQIQILEELARQLEQ